LAGVLAVCCVDCPPAGAPLDAGNIFQIVHRERVLFVQAANCVERAEWVRLLSALCRRAPVAAPHRAYYCGTRWTCCGRSEPAAEGCGGGALPGEREAGVAAGCGEGVQRYLVRGAAALALRLDPARDLQRLHALLVAHAALVDARLHRTQDDTSPEEREAEAVTLREMQKVMFDLEHRHCIHRRSLARETKYGSKQAPIGDDNYLHLAGAATNVDSGSFLWRSWRGNVSPTIDLDGKALPLQPSIDICSSSESLKLARQGDERSSGKSNKSTGSGYLTMSCIKHEPSEDSDASNEKPARPPKPARLSPSRPTLTSPATPLCEYIDVDRKPPVRRPKPDLAPRRPDYEARCKEYELMANFMSHAQPEDDVPPAVPPRGNTARVRLQPKPAETEVRKSEDPAIQCNLSNSLNSLPEATHSELSFESSRRQERPLSKTDTVSNDDSLLDELQRDTYCVLKVCEDDIPDEPIEVKCGKDRKDKEEYGVFSRISLQRKSNPIKTQPKSIKPLKTSNSTSNVHDVASGSSRPLSERLTLFLKKKPKPDPKTAQSKSEDGQSGKSGRKEEKDNLIGRLTPRFGQSRLYNRGQSLDLTTDSHTRRIERSATTVSIPRPINSSIVAMKFLTLHRYGAQDEVQCRAFVQNSGEDRDVEDGAAARPEDSPRDCGGPLQYSSSEAEGLEGGAWRRNHGPLLTAATNDIRL
ncbi:uncharacterized protein LOC126971300, partial [Leptidea sinapis]|uniref:uncharacterized protein LOC126971300 n=1 Tax=Leptidea sinapis TaxID=189913 RepID=UPI0021C4BDF1